jgi:hypothetical protein
LKLLRAGLGVEPPRVSLVVEDDRHPVMHRPDDVVRRGGDEGDRFQVIAPPLPNPREGEGAILPESELVRHLGRPGEPLKEPVGRQQATAALEGRAKGPALGDRLAPRVDIREPDFRFLRPTRDEAPPRYCDGFRSCGRDGQDPIHNVRDECTRRSTPGSTIEPQVD